MISRLCSFNFCRTQTLISSQSIRHLALTTLRIARTSGFRSNISEQFSFRSQTVAGKSLRERLLGPTTGKPFIYGTYAVAGASVFGIGMLCYYGLGMSKELNAIDRSM